jgi:hypothetical protein
MAENAVAEVEVPRRLSATQIRPTRGLVDRSAVTNGWVGVREKRLDFATATNLAGDDPEYATLRVLGDCVVQVKTRQGENVSRLGTGEYPVTVPSTSGKDDATYEFVLQKHPE